MKLHHIGYVVGSIEAYEKKMLFESKLKEVVDELQQARLSLYTHFSDVLIELIEPLNESAFTYGALKKFGDHHHHLCYAVSTETQMQFYANLHRMFLFKAALPAKLFDGKPVYFFYTGNKTIVEFLIDADL
jgi:hypothetical protein